MRYLILVLFLCFSFQVQGADSILQRNSFSGPFRDNIKHWRMLGDAKIPSPSSSYIELTSTQPQKKGSIWNLVTLKPIDWEVKVHISFGPSQPKTVAAGTAIWLTQDKETTGTAFGSSNVWNGLAVIFDTYDNNGDGFSPLLYGVWNNGDEQFDHNKDNKQDKLQVLGTCRVTRDSNAEYIIKLVYLNGKLTVSYQNPMTMGHNDFEYCFAKEIFIRRGNYLGVSSNTGGFFDHHKVHSLSAYTLGENDNFRDDDPSAEPNSEPQHEPQAEPTVTSEPAIHTGWNSDDIHDANRQQQQQQRQIQDQHQQQQQHEFNEQKRQAEQQMKRAESHADEYERELREKIDVQIKKHLELEQAIIVLSQEADELFNDLENRASHELRELQNKVVLLHPEVESLSNAKPSIIEIETAIQELQNSLDHLEKVTYIENEKMDSLGNGFVLLPNASSWDKWVWLIIIQSVGVILVILIQKCRKPAKSSRF